MHAVITLQPSTLPQASRLLERIADLGGVSQYPCLLVSSGELDLAPLHKLAASAFQSVSVFPIEIPPDYPKPNNILFSRTAQQMGMHVGDSYLYLEPDSWPTSSHWFKDLVSAYREHNLKFMGKLADMVMHDGRIEKYMMTTGFYPKGFYYDSHLIKQIPANVNASEFLQGEIVYGGKAHDSGLFVVGNEDERNAALVIHYHDADDLDDEGRAPHENGYTGPSEYLSVKAAREALDAPSVPAPGFFSAAFGDMGKPAEVEDLGDLDAVSTPQGIVSGREYKARHLPVEENEKSRSDGPLPHLDGGRAIFRGKVIDLTLEYPTVRANLEKLSSEAVKLDESWVNDPRALDPNVEVPTPVAAAVIPEGLPDSGHLPSFPQPAEPALVFATEEERNQAIKKSQAEGLGWKALLSLYKMSPVAMKKVLNSVG